MARILSAAAFSVVAWSADRLDVFKLGRFNNLLQRSWSVDTWQSNWTDRGGEFTSPVASCSWDEGRLDIFGRGGGNRAYHLAYDSAWGVWQDSYDSPGRSTSVFSSALSVVAWGPDRLDVFGIGTDSQLYHQAWNGNSWLADWENIEGGPDLSSDPVAVSWGPQRLDIFAVVANDRSLGHFAWSPSRGARPGMVQVGPNGLAWKVFSAQTTVLRQFLTGLESWWS